MTNEYGMELDRNGYSESILQEDTTCCFACQRRGRKLDRHEAFPSSNRQKSKAYGLWVTLCHDPCHLGKDGYQFNANKAYGLKAFAQIKAMEYYGWDIKEFRSRFGKNYLKGGEE